VPMRLIDHLKTTGEKVDEFATRAGESPNTIRKIVYGQRQPSLPLAVKISALTKGAVSAADLVVAPVEKAA
jgi:DNA-binding XRE family transcriptional regulator